MSVAGFADIVVPVPLDQPFTYRIPDELPLAPGMRVRVPWGTRQLTGVVAGLRNDPPAGVKPEQIKAVREALDAAPLLDTAMLELVRWAAAYYQAPVGEVMRCALPPGDGRKPKLQVRYRLAGKSGEPGAGRSTAAQSAVLERLRQAGGEMDAAELRASASPSALATLERRGAIARIECDAPLPAPSWQARPRVETLNSSQQRALAVIMGRDAEAAPAPILLHGVTGSGKTAVYLAAIDDALARGQSALLLVPEIGLTPALFADFTDAFPGQVAVLHSGLSDGERAAFWFRLHQGAARVAIGTRSAVFAPVRQLGLILVDEEHDPSFKQIEAPRYHGRDLAVMRARLSGARIVLGSATPSLETYAHAKSGKYRLVEMTERVHRRPLPTVRLVHMGEEFQKRAAEKNTPELLFSEPLLAALEDRLARSQQSLLLINRRGFAPVALCRSCGATAQCRDCALSLTLHKRDGRMLCHFCGYAAPPPSECAQCGSEYIYFLGSGSEKVEEELALRLPSARLARLDRDTARSRKHFEHTLASFRRAEIDVLIGTQMIAKGHDVPGVTLVGVLQADLGLTFPDFRAAERTYQLLTQVAGRAGRGRESGEVIIQVQHPEHYAVSAAAANDFAAFYEKEANFRRWMHYPPFAALAAVQLRHRDLDKVHSYASQAAAFLRQRAASAPATKVLGPAPAIVARAKNEFRYQFLFKGESRRELNQLLRELRQFAAAKKFPATALVVDVDPLSL